MIKSALILLILIGLSTSLHLHLQGNVRDLNDWNFANEMANLRTGRKIIYFSSPTVKHKFITAVVK